MSTQTMANAFARPRASLVALSLAAVFALGVGSGVVVSSGLRQSVQSIGLGGGTVAADSAAQAHLAWLQSEHGSYGGTVAADSAAQAHLAWLQSEHGSYGGPAAAITDEASWQAYRQFRLSEEGYAP